MPCPCISGVCCGPSKTAAPQPWAAPSNGATTAKTRASSFAPAATAIVPSVKGWDARIGSSSAPPNCCGALLSRGFHAAGTGGRHRLLQQRDRLSHPVPHRRRDPAHHFPRPQTLGCGDRFLLLTCTASFRAAECLPRASGMLAFRDFSPGTRAQPPVPPPLSGGSRKGPRRRPAPVLSMRMATGAWPGPRIWMRTMVPMPHWGQRLRFLPVRAT